jgi:hypothetical protein
MEQEPSTRRQLRAARTAGEEAQVTERTLHIRFVHQEETLLKQKSRLVWLGAFVALMAMLGTVSVRPGTADAQAPPGTTATLRVCKVGTGTAVNQLFTFNLAGGTTATNSFSLLAGTGTGNCRDFEGISTTAAVPFAISETSPAGFAATNIEVTPAGSVSNVAASVPNQSVAFTINAAATGTITVTFTNAPCTVNCPVPPTGTTVTVNKVCVGAPTGTFTLAVGTGATGTSFPGILCGGSTGAVAVTAGTSISVGEPTIPAGVTASISCTGATNPSYGTGANAGLATFTPATGQNIVCTVTNTVTVAQVTLSPTSKICVQYQPIANVIECDLAILFPQGLPGGATIEVTIVGADLRDDLAALAINAGCPGATVTRVPAPPANTFRITAPPGGCAPGVTIVVSEKLNCRDVNVISQTLVLRNAAGMELDRRSINATGPGGQPLTVCTTAPIVNPVIAGATKVCRPYAPVAGVLECDLSLPLASPGGIPAGGRVLVTLSPAASARFRLDAGVYDVLVVAGCPGATIENRTANSFEIVAPTPAGCPFPSTILVSQKIDCLTNITPGLLSETVLVRNREGQVIGTAAPGLVVPFTGPGGQPLSFPCRTEQAATAVKVCRPVVDGTPGPAFVRVGQVVTCTVTITNTAAGQVSPAGNVEVTLGNASFVGAADSAVTVTNIGATLTSGNVATIPCNAIDSLGGLARCQFTESFVAGPNACTTMSQTIRSLTGGPFSFSFNPIRLDSAVATSPEIFVLPKAESGIVCPGQVSGFAGNEFQFLIRCTNPSSTELAGLVQGVVPGPIGGTQTLAVGILPSAIICEAGFLASTDARDAAFRPAAPGTIEVSSLNGTLINLNGGVSTNLRIGCGTGAVVNLNDPISTVVPTIDVNTCRGVRFGVLGLGVGFVELRARYEPTALASQAGILEREATGSVAFIAPAANISLLLSPNPVGVGQTGTATARFNRVFTFGNEVLVNPSTGAPLFINLGTPLNGSVTFTSSNPAVASFTGSGFQSGELATGIIQPAGTPTTGQLIAPGGAQVTVRCGAATPVFAGAGIPTVVTAASFAGFFGGCTDASAAYRGNAIGSTTITATFAADLPNAFGAGFVGGFNNAGVTGTGVSFGNNVAALFNLFGNLGTNSAQANLEVVQLATTTVRLVAGCNNVVAVATESPAQVAARVDPTAAVISVWKQIPGTTMFMGAAIGQAVPAGVSNLTAVNALDAIFICVNAAATYRIA